MSNLTISLKEAARLVNQCGQDVTFIFQGEPGIGKSSILSDVAENSSQVPKYIDCALIDLGDLQGPKMEPDMLRFLPNEWFVSPDGAPLCIMLDEIGKAPRPVQNGLLTLMLEHRIGSHSLPEGSTVFGTTNMATDGVGDMVQAHAKDRVTFLTVRKPNSEEWMEWAINNDVDPTIIAFAKEFPQIFASYTDEAQDDNPYIFHPKRSQTKFLSPRSLYKANHIAKRREYFTDDLLITALAGTFGESAARDMHAFFNVADTLPSHAEIIKDPEGCFLPESPVGAVILALRSAMLVEKDTVDAWMQYLQRLPTEVQYLFAHHSVNSAKVSVVTGSRRFTKWCADNAWAV